MRNLLLYNFKLFGFWIVLFFLHRQIFLIFHFTQLADLPFIEILRSNWKAIPMDISSACYFVLVPVILLSLGGFQNKLIYKVVFYFSTLLIVVSSFINLVDIGLSLSWGNRINIRALSYLNYPKEAMASVGSSPVFILILTFLITSIAGIWFFAKYIHKKVEFNLSILQKVIVPIFLIGLLFIGSRGGLGIFPISKKWVYYSKYNVLNLAAVNGNWNFINVLVKRDAILANPYNFMPTEEARSVVEQLNTAKYDSVTNVLSTIRPNIIFVLLESWTNDVIGPLGGEEDITPFFNDLCSEGLLFKNMYATGFRTEQGLIAYNSGFPAQPKTTIMREFGKFESLPSMIKLMQNRGYHTSFYYGSSLDFANMRSYLYTAGFEKIIGQEDFEFEKKTRWGAYDEELFNFFLSDSENMPEPFVTMLLTLTSHEPYDAIIEHVFPHKGLPNKFRNTVYYTDKCLGDFMHQAKKKPWYENSLFIFIADHSHSLPMEYEYNEPGRHMIPFLMYGEVLKEEFRGKILDAFGSQIDIPVTLLNQLEIPHSEFFWSKDLFNPTHHHFGYYTFNEGFGYITPEQTLVWDQNLEKIIHIGNPDMTSMENEQFLNQGQAILQLIMDQFVNGNN